jgi:hypothetical protein
VPALHGNAVTMFAMVTAIHVNAWAGRNLV